jgi:hypothetical protein
MMHCMMYMSCVLYLDYSSWPWDAHPTTPDGYYLVTDTAFLHGPDQIAGHL